MTKRNVLVSLLLVGSLFAMAASAKPKPKPKPESKTPEVEGSYEEIEPIGGVDKLKFESLGNFCLDQEGNILACGKKQKTIVKISPAGKHIATWKLEFSPASVSVNPDGRIYAVGSGVEDTDRFCVITELDKAGKTLKSIRIPRKLTEAEKKEAKDKAAAKLKVDMKALEQRIADGTASREDNRKKRMADAYAKTNNGALRPVYVSTTTASDIVVSGTDVFVAFGYSKDTKGTGVCRFDLNLENKKVLVTELRVCCSRLGIAYQNDVIYIAENTKFRVLRYDREGKKLGEWGERDRSGMEGFGSCCNPTNLCLTSDGTVITSETGLARIKKHDPDTGKFLGLAGYLGQKQFTRAGRASRGCTSACVAVKADGSRIYIQDTKNNVIRILAIKNAKSE